MRKKTAKILGIVQIRDPEYRKTAVACKSSKFDDRRLRDDKHRKDWKDSSNW